MTVEKGNEKTISFLLTCEKGNPPKKFAFSHGGRKIEIFFPAVRSEKKNLFSFHKKSLIFLILVGKNSFFSDFFSCEKGNSKKSLSFSHAEREIPQKNFPSLMRKGKLKKNSSLPFSPRSLCWTYRILWCWIVSNIHTRSENLLWLLMCS